MQRLSQASWTIISANCARVTSASSFGSRADGSTDSAATDIDFIEVFRTVMDEGREEFLHSQRTAAAPDIAGDLCDFFYRNQFHRLFAGYFGTLVYCTSSAMGTTKT